jgi:hypothetical protein
MQPHQDWTLERLDPAVVPLLKQQDAGQLLIDYFRQNYPPEKAVAPATDDQPDGNRAWELAAVRLHRAGKVYESLSLLWELYLAMLAAQHDTTRFHKGMPLVRLSDCFLALGFTVHARRYSMLAFCEDAITLKGALSPRNTGAYFRLIASGVTEDQLRRYSQESFQISEEQPEDALFPEALLQRLDDAWLTEFPSVTEALSYRVNKYYVEHLLAKLGDPTGKPLEQLAVYLMSCMPGCRARHRRRTPSTDFDVVCAMEGFDLDFRSELGRHFVCECKDWDRPADFTVMAKLCRVLDSTKSRFGILFSKSGISGAGKTTDAAREQLKVFQDRGIIIVVLDLDDLKYVAKGANLIALLRGKYEAVRLDLTGANL